MTVHPYSKRFYRAHGLNGTDTSGAVPAGKIWIVRDIDSYSSSGASPQVWWVKLNTTGIPFATFKLAAFSQDGVQWRGRQVLVEGEVITIDTNTYTVDIMISGYELSA